MKKKLLLLLFISLLWMDAAQGSFISINTKTSTTFQENTLIVEVSVTNKGDEAAYNVQINIDANEKTASTPVKDVLKINETHTVKTTFDMRLQQTGRYPLIITVDYTDLNQYPFSAISSAYFIYKENVSQKIHGKFNNLEISKRGKLVLHLKSLLDKDKKIRIKMIVPRELSVLKPITDIEMNPKSEKVIKYDIKNFSALTGSNYQIFAVIVYNDNNKHVTVSIPCVVKVIEGTDFAKKYKWIFVGIGIAILALFLGLQFWPKKTTK